MCGGVPPPQEIKPPPGACAALLHRFFTKFPPPPPSPYPPMTLQGYFSQHHAAPENYFIFFSPPSSHRFSVGLLIDYHHDPGVPQSRSSSAENLQKCFVILEMPKPRIIHRYLAGYRVLVHILYMKFMFMSVANCAEWDV